MTNKEAVKTLKANYPDACYELLREAVDMAIEALKATACNNLATDLQPCKQDDLISRQVANSKICNACGMIDCDQMDKCEKMFTAQPETHEERTETHACDCIERQAVEHLDWFTKLYCRDKSITDDLAFRCEQCEFEMPDDRCLVKVMARKLCPDYKDFGAMGDL